MSGLTILFRRLFNGDRHGDNVLVKTPEGAYQLKLFFKSSTNNNQPHWLIHTDLEPSNDS